MGERKVVASGLSDDELFELDCLLKVGPFSCFLLCSASPVAASTFTEAKLSARERKLSLAEWQRDATNGTKLDISADKLKSSSDRSPLRRRQSSLTAVLDTFMAEEGPMLAPAPASDPNSVSSLIEERRELIDALRYELEGTRDETDDDIVLLKYAMSFKELAPAKEAFLKMKKYRKEHTDLFEMARVGKQPDNTMALKGKLVLGVWQHLTASGQCIHITRVGHCDLSGASQNASVEDIIDFLIFQKLRCSQILDAVTRKTGRIVRCFGCLDMHDMSLSQAQNKVVRDAFSQHSRLSEFLFPQFADKLVIVNSPWFINMLLAIGKRIMPAKFMRRLAVCPARGTATAGPSDIAKCPFIRQHFPDLSKLPDFLGGSAPIEPKSALYVSGSPVYNR